MMSRQEKCKVKPRCANDPLGYIVARNGQCIAIVAEKPWRWRGIVFPEREDMKTNSLGYAGAPEVAL
jgi:hypothetical protein